MSKHTKEDKRRKQKRISDDIRKERAKGTPREKAIAVAISKEQQREKKKEGK